MGSEARFTHHLEPKKFDQVDSGGQGRSKYGPKLPLYCPLLFPILTFPNPPCRPDQIFLVQNGVYMCPAYSTTCFKFNQHLRGYFRPRKSILAKIAIFGCFLGLFTPPLGCHFGNIETCNAYYRPLYLGIRLTQEGFCQNLVIM